MEASGYTLLGRIESPADLRRLAPEDLPQLAREIRRHLIETLGRVGGHFSANLGTVELTLALHRALETPHDRLVWDVGHQAYAHKIVTGRRARLESIRSLGGLAPFLTPEESEYDAAVGGHAGTAISVAAGMAAAVRLKGERRRVVAVIGDGGLTAGLAFEALNHAGAEQLDLLIVGNDNDYSISENVGALRHGVARHAVRAGLAAPHHLRPAPEAGALADPQAFFGALGIAYHGPIDGHDLVALEKALSDLRDARGPQFLHVLTTKGKGFAAAEADPIGYHGVTRFDSVTGAFATAQTPSRPTYSAVFGEWLCAAAERDPRVVAITPAMREGSGLVEFAHRFPQRHFDVGIAEQHALTLAAGLAAQGLRPVVAIYSTFLQRALDQLIHDIALPRLPVLLAIDRGGLVGADGATHQGAFDLAFLRSIPNLLLMAPSDEHEAQALLDTGLMHDGPAAVRYPRGRGPGTPLRGHIQCLPIGRGQVVRETRGRRRPQVAFLSSGALLAAVLEAADLLDATVADLRFVKPLDRELILRLAAEADLLVSVEDGVRAGGVGSAIAELLAEACVAKPLLILGLPDRFVAHGTREEQLAECGLDAAGLLRSVQRRLQAVKYSNAGASREAASRPSR